jgi:hypothetical protein
MRNATKTEEGERLLHLWIIPGLTIGKSQILRARQEEEADRDFE